MSILKYNEHASLNTKHEINLEDWYVIKIGYSVSPVSSLGYLASIILGYGR